MACGDRMLYREAIAELQSEPSLKDQSIGVRVRDGVVTLVGHVDSEAMRHVAVEAIDLLGGVRVIIDALEVGLRE